MKKRYVTIKDIARELGISVSTVSRAMRDTYDVSQETREKVLAKAKELRYKPNLNATGLVQNSTRTIGVIVPTITNYYFSTVITGIQEIALANNFHIVLYISNDQVTLEHKIIEDLSRANLDGLLICITSQTKDSTVFEAILNEGMPIVFFDRVLEITGTSRVLQDDKEGAYKATQHLIEKGYKKIVHITGPETLLLTQNRIEGYKQALADYNITFSPQSIIHSGFTQQDGDKDIQLLLQQPPLPDAIFAVNDRKAIGALLALKRSGYKIGSDIAVIGFTNDPMCEVISPTLTSINEPAYDVGKEACTLLLKHIRKKAFTGDQVVLSCKLIERDSTQPATLN